MTSSTDQEPALYFPFQPDRNGNGSDAPVPSYPPLVQVGGKALSLLQASSRGFAVPRGLVLTVDFFAPWLKQLQKQKEWKGFVNKINTKNGSGDNDKTIGIDKEDCDALKEACHRLLDKKWIDAQQESTLEKAIAEVFGSSSKSSSLLVAVRSSSPEEDLAGSSFAGGYETALGVSLLGGSRHSELRKALVTSFASMLDYRVVQYKLQMTTTTQDKAVHDSILNPRIAVVVQEQLNSASSGVAFSLNPSNNCYDEITISANFGLGESVVSGIVTPDVYVVLNNNDQEDDDKSKNRFEILDKRIGKKEEAIWLASTHDDKDEKAGGTIQTSNSNPETPALSDEHILQVADLVARVEREYQKLMQEPGKDATNGHSPCPVDIEWAFVRDPTTKNDDDEGSNGKLYLLQARPITTYIPLFPEMLTPRGSPKRNLYLDVIVMTQGFNEPFSVLGLDIWKTFLGIVKPQFSREGPEGMSWNLHGRQYMHISNHLTTLGGQKLIEKGIGKYDPALGRAFASINIDDYVPIETPSGANGFIWKQLGQVRIALPAMLWGLYLKDKALDEYLEYIDELMNEYSEEKDSLFLPYEDFETMASSSMKDWATNAMSAAARIVASYWSRWRLSKLFQGQEGTDDLLVSLCMDLKGNPTSEMGHAMLRLASMPEYQETMTSEEFCKKIQDGAFSDEFLMLYKDFMKRYGCRGMKEIDVASPRTSEDPAGLFDRLKQIDIEDNAIINVSERRQLAHDKLLEMAVAMGKESTFKYHDHIIQSLMGYREHPKYIYVYMVAMYRRRALKIADTFVEQGRLDNADQIFNLTMSDVSAAQKDSSLDLRSKIDMHLEPYKQVQNVKTWPLLIDSRGKIIRKKRKDTSDDPNVLLGDPIAPGKVRGKAKVLNAPYEKPLHSGEVLVARFTEPSWTPIFVNAIAVVMEVGGPLQHGAIIAREYGIPCVSGLDNATTLIKDGDYLEVDGSTGTIRYLERGSVVQADDEK